LLTVLLTACASGPNPALERAQAAYNQARQDPQIAANAPVQLRDAEATLQRAEQVWRESGDSEEVQHLTYLAERKVEIARALSERKLADRAADQAAEARTQAMLEARTREAELTKRKLAELQSRETDRGLVLTVGDVLFEVDRAELKPGALLNLAPLADFLRENPNRNVLIEGHTDNTGSAAYNQDLSQRRAEAVRQFLIQQGISPGRLIARGYGEAYPVTSNSNPAGRQQNRRVEIVVQREGEASISRIR
jgi:outer membrane protein OmpA-like peptidoglycan-associated protein